MSNGWGILEDGTVHTLGSSHDVVAFDRTRGTSSGEIASPLRACGGLSEGVNDGKADAQCVAFELFGGSKRKDRPNGGFYARTTETAKPLDTSGLNPGCAQGGILPYGVRRLTPTECERLQGFPDGWTAGQSDTQRYKQLGNAITVFVVEWIGHRIMAIEKGGV